MLVVGKAFLVSTPRSVTVSVHGVQMHGAQCIVCLILVLGGSPYFELVKPSRE